MPPFSEPDAAAEPVPDVFAEIADIAAQVCVKIDGSFVRGSAGDRINEAVVDAIARLAQAVGAYTVAESVETGASLERMKALGIDFAQGYGLHRPEPYAELAARMHYAPANACSVHAA
jgi:EAL domain-containing protein (putative c-di-GMP-specific phosphodiesterase class I)